MELWPKELKKVSYLITRYAVFETLYLQGASSVKSQLTKSVIKLYAAILTYLSKASHYYDQKTTSMPTKGSCFVQDELTCYKERLAKSVFKSAEVSVQAYLDQISKEQYEVDSVVRLANAEKMDNLTTEVRHKMESLLLTLDEPMVRMSDQLSNLHDNLQSEFDGMYHVVTG